MASSENTALKNLLLAAQALLRLFHRFGFVQDDIALFDQFAAMFDDFFGLGDIGFTFLPELLLRQSKPSN